jgi:phage FluMu protein Com
VVPLSQQPPSTSVLRCSFCGAPLPHPTAQVFRVQCPYCTVENRLLSAEAAQHRIEALQAAAKEREGIEQRAERQRQALEVKMQEALIAGDGEAAVRHFEGMIRMSYAATIHLYRNGMPPEHAEPALRQIDEVIGQAVRSFAQELRLPIT